ncbi:MAG TPA: response regulator [Gemmataceae bacterium]|jgi:response regulator NasT|nr:response regulator [Gemmataceae bacterium]
MTVEELRHEILDMLQSVYVLSARLKVLLPEDAREAREVIEQLLKRARLCKDRVTGVAPTPVVERPELSPTLPRLRAVVVEDDPNIREYIIDVLSRQCGHEVVATASSGPDMVRQVLTKTPDLVVFDIHLPGMDGLSALHEISKQHAVAAVAVTGDRDSELLQRALEDNILAYLLKPIDAQQLIFAIQLAWARFNEFCTLKSENQTLQKNLQDRKIIEKAKGALMKRHRWTEDKAFRTLQKRAMDLRLPMVHLAQEILNGRDLE